MPENKLVPELSVSDLEQSLRFYRDIIGFKVEFERPEDRFAYLSFHGSELMIEEDRERDGDSALWIVEPLDYPRGRGLNLSIDCPDARDLVARLSKARIQLRKPLEECWYRNNEILHGELNFLVQDPDGYLVRFAQNLGTRIRNASEVDRDMNLSMGTAIMKVSVICHGNIARSQILHHYLAHYADRAGVRMDLFSCGTAPVGAYPDAGRLIIEVGAELMRRGLIVSVERHTLDEDARQKLLNSDLILVADRARREEILAGVEEQIEPGKVSLFYEFIGEGQKDFVDTYDASKGAQDPERFARCFDELERIAKLTVDRLGGVSGQSPG